MKNICLSGMIDNVTPLEFITSIQFIIYSNFIPPGLEEKSLKG